MNPFTDVKQCKTCKATLPLDAAFCPTCGAAIDRNVTDAKSFVESPDDVIVVSQTARWLSEHRHIVLMSTLAAFLVVLLGAFFYANARVRADVEQRAMYSKLTASYNALSNKLHTLAAAKASIAAASGGVNTNYARYSADLQSASAAGQQRHDAEGASDVKLHDLAQQELRAINDAQTAQGAIEVDDATLLSQYDALYGQAATRQLRSDLASRNAARENSLAEWNRAITSINDNITASMNFQSGSYSSSDITTHYTESTRDSNEAVRYGNLSDADGTVLLDRLDKDIANTRSQLRSIKTSYPTVAK